MMTQCLPLRNYHLRFIPLGSDYSVSTADIESFSTSLESCAFKCAGYGCCLSFSYRSDTRDCVLSSEFPQLQKSGPFQAAEVFTVKGK